MPERNVSTAPESQFAVVRVHQIAAGKPPNRPARHSVASPQPLQLPVARRPENPCAHPKRRRSDTRRTPPAPAPRPPFRIPRSRRSFPGRATKHYDRHNGQPIRRPPRGQPSHGPLSRPTAPTERQQQPARLTEEENHQQDAEPVQGFRSQPAALHGHTHAQKHPPHRQHGPAISPPPAAGTGRSGHQTPQRIFTASRGNQKQDRYKPISMRFLPLRCPSDGCKYTKISPFPPPRPYSRGLSATVSVFFRATSPCRIRFSSSDFVSLFDFCNKPLMEKNPVIDSAERRRFPLVQTGQHQPQTAGRDGRIGRQSDRQRRRNGLFHRQGGQRKSSLIKTLYAELPLFEGEGRIVGFDLRHMKRRDISRLRRSIGIVSPGLPAASPTATSSATSTTS